MNRREFLVGAMVASMAMVGRKAEAQVEPGDEDVRAFERMAGFELRPDERKELLEDLQDLRKAYEAARSEDLGQEIQPPTPFAPAGSILSQTGVVRVRVPAPRNPRAPKSPEDLAFLDVATLGSLLRSKQVTSVRLTRLALQRLKRFGPGLRCVASLLESSALREARQADREFAQGKDRGPLHGIPYAIKDLFACGPTQWGAEPFVGQTFARNAHVVERLREAGAVLCAKLSMGALAMGDHWYEGLTRNPWNLAQGSSGSSAGSAAAVSAGLVPFAIGTETYGSIVSPSQRCRVTGLRPTFGRVGRGGAMSLSYTLDKVGPICRTVEDTALVLSQICGRDPRDPAAVAMPLTYNRRRNLRDLRIGFVGRRGDAIPALAAIARAGGTVDDVELPAAPEWLLLILSVEAASAFDTITRDGRVNTISESAWPRIFRAHRLVPGVEYLQAMRHRAKFMSEFAEAFSEFHCVVANDNGGPLLWSTNLTGHPQIYVPLGTDEKGEPRGVSVIGRLYEEGPMLSVARAIQEAFDFHRLRPDLSKLEQVGDAENGAE